MFSCEFCEISKNTFPYRTPLVEVIYKHQVNNGTISYKYLGVELTSSLNLKSQFNRSYKKVSSRSSRLKTLHRLGHFLTKKSAKDVFNLMVLPTLSYSSYLKPSFSNTQVKKLRSLERRSKSIINNFDPNIINQLKKKVRFFVYDVSMKRFAYLWMTFMN